MRVKTPAVNLPWAARVQSEHPCHWGHATSATGHGARSPAKVASVCCLILFAWLPNASAAPVLEPHLWENRILLLFAPDEGDTALQQTRDELERQACEMEDRDFVVGYILTKGSSRLGDRNLSASQAASLRGRYGIESQRFTALLIGKDGGEKRRDTSVPDLNSLFNLIDGMPMRRQEMQTHPSKCTRAPVSSG